MQREKPKAADCFLADERQSGKKIPNCYVFSPKTKSYDYGLREIFFNPSMLLPWSFRHDSVIAIELDVLQTGEKFSGFKCALEKAYMQLPEALFPRKKFWTETIQSPYGMRDRIYMRIDSVPRVLGMLHAVKLDDSKGEPLVSSSLMEKILPSFSNKLSRQ